MLAARLLVLLALAPLLGGCARSSADAEFAALANRCLAGLRELDPQWATELGDHRFDHLLPELGASGAARRIALCRAYHDSLGRLDSSKLAPASAIDLQILRLELEGRLFALEELREHEWNPLHYNVSGALYNLLARDFAPLPVRLRAVKARLLGIPNVLAAARSNLQHPPRVFTETAILQNEGSISLIRDDLDEFLAQEPRLREELAAARASAVAELQAYGRWLEDELLPRSDGDFRLGSELFRRKLRHRLGSELTPEDILASAERDLLATQRELFETARPLYERFFPEMSRAVSPPAEVVIAAVLGKLAENHPDNETIVTQVQLALASATAFVKQHDLVTVPPEPLQIIVMPEFQRGVAVAYCDAPGPLESECKTFLSISPTPCDWTPELTASFFREYNFYMLLNLTVHEAMPGHYLQFMHTNRFQAATLVRVMLPSGTFVEGWATYAEQMMTEQGFGGPEVRMQALKMKLRQIINAILDQEIHAGDMTEREALDLMLREGFQEQGEANRKWRRACLSSCQLSTYYVGNLEINRIRDAWAAKRGVPVSQLDLKQFHDVLLSFGAPPPQYARELMGL